MERTSCTCCLIISFNGAKITRTSCDMFRACAQINKRMEIVIHMYVFPEPHGFIRKQSYLLTRRRVAHSHWKSLRDVTVPGSNASTCVRSDERMCSWWFMSGGHGRQGRRWSGEEVFKNFKHVKFILRKKSRAGKNRSQKRPRYVQGILVLLSGQKHS